MAGRKGRKKTSFTAKELAEFQKIIEGKLATATEQLEYYLQQMSETADNPDSKIKGLDDGVSTVENERLITMAGRQKKLVQHLQNALLRVKNRTYGYCRETGELISKERLRAVPHATLSIKAKQGRR